MLKRISATECYERGLLLKKFQVFDMALTEFQQAVTDPQQAGKAFTQAALCLKTLGREEEAVTAFRQALETGSLSSKDQLHIEYCLAQTLESLDREFEALVVYRRIRREDPNYLEVEARIQDLSSGRLTPRHRVTAGQRRDVVKLWAQLKPQLASVVSQTWQRLARYTEMLESYYPMTSTTSGGAKRDQLVSTEMQARASVPADQLVPAQKERDRRSQGRVPVQMLSQLFSSKAPIVAGEGEIRDLSPSGCRITSPLRVPVGTAVECWIYPQNGNPFAVDEARVQWIGHREFGLRFTNVRIGIQRQIMNMCRVMAPL